MYKISLIIPIYNTSKTFEKTFDSIFCQTIGFENIELIYVDDCSTDDSANIIGEKIKLYDNVKYYSTEKNSGFPSRPRNIGIKNASSDYIMFLDQDDVFFKDACETLYNLISTNDVDLVSGNYIKTFQSKSDLMNWNMVNIDVNEIICIDNIDKNKELLRLNPSIWTKIYKKSFLIENNISFVNEILIEDVIFVSECLLNANGIIFINKPIINYLIRSSEDKIEEGSLSIAKNKKVLYALINGIKIFNNILKNYPKEYHWLAVRHLNYWMIQFVESSLSRDQKLELLIYSHELFEDYGSYDRIEPAQKYNLIFKKIINKEFNDAIMLSEHLNLLNKPRYTNDVLKSTDFLIISKNFNQLKQKNLIYKLSESGFKIAVLNVNLKNFSDKFNYLLMNNKSNDSLDFYDFYDFYFYKSEFYSPINEYYKNESSINNEFRINKELYENYEIINYLDKDSEILFKKEYWINNMLIYEIEYKNKEIITERFFNKTGANYLSIYHNEGLIYEFKNYMNNTTFNFYSEDEVIKYFFNEIFLKYSNKCILNFEKNYINLLEDIKSVNTVIHYIDDEDISDLDFFEKQNELYNESYIVSPNSQFLNNIKSEYGYSKGVHIPISINFDDEIYNLWIKCLNKIVIEKKLSNFDDFINLNNYKNLVDKFNSNFENFYKSNNKELNHLSRNELIFEIDRLIQFIENQNNEIVQLKEDIIKLL